MNAPNRESSAKNGGQPGIEHGRGRFLSLSVMFEMNPSLRDLTANELSELLDSPEYTQEWAPARRPILPTRLETK